jgi:pimeloyl-ACP methyl ester carboxylesterase
VHGVRSKDGTHIGFHAAGRGRPLVLVHGSGDTHARWAAVLPDLEARFSVYVMDRRGRGASGDAPQYAFAREAEDVAAVMRAADRECGQAPAVLAHSFGALCAIDASLIADRAGPLLLYEPPIPVPGEPDHAVFFLQTLSRLLERGDYEEIWTAFLGSVMGMTEREIAESRQSPTWGERVRLARLLPREAEARARYVPELERLRAAAVPALIMEASASPSFLRRSARALHEALPGSRLASLPGQGHVAMSSAPSAFLEPVLEFLGGPAT